MAGDLRPSPRDCLARALTANKRMTLVAKRSKKGSAMIFVLIMVVAITGIVVVGSTYTSALNSYSRRYEDEAMAEEAFNAAVAQLDDDASYGTVTLPSTRTVSLNGVTGTLTCTDNSANISKSILVSGTLTTSSGRTYPMSGVVPNSGRGMYNFALFANSNINTSKDITTGSLGSNGDIHVNGNLTLNGGLGTTINGDAEATGTVGPVTLITVGGSAKPNATAITFPTLTSSTYAAAADVTLGSTTLTGAQVFPSGSNGNYYLAYVAGNLILNASSFSGKGTIYVTGTVDIKGTVTYADSSSELVIITPGNVNFDFDMIGYFFTAGTCNWSKNISVSRGGLYAKTISVNNVIDITLDPYLKSHPGDLYKLHMPGYWP